VFIRLNRICLDIVHHYMTDLILNELSEVNNYMPCGYSGSTRQLAMGVALSTK